MKILKILRELKEEILYNVDGSLFFVCAVLGFILAGFAYATNPPIRWICSVLLIIDFICCVYFYENS